MKTFRSPPPGRSRGVALVVVLVLLLIMTVVGLATLRGAALEERMSAALYDRSLAFQSAELALREAEDAVRKSTTPGALDVALDCSLGSPDRTTAQCGVIPTGSAAFSDKGTVWSDANDAQALSAGAPQYVVQYMGKSDSNLDLGIPEDPNYGAGSGLSTAEYYRVTARSNDPTSDQGKARAVTLLQSTIVRE